MLKPSSKIRFRRGKISVQSDIGLSKENVLSKFNEVLKEVEGRFANILIESYLPNVDETMHSLGKILETLKMDCKNDRINDAYIIIEPQSFGTDLYISLLRRKITMAFGKDVLEVDGLEDLVCSLYNIADLESGTTLKISNFQRLSELSSILKALGNKIVTINDLSIIGYKDSTKLLESILMSIVGKIKVIRISHGEENLIRLSSDRRSIEISLKEHIDELDRIISKLLDLENVDFIEVSKFRSIGDLEGVIEMVSQIGDRLTVVEIEFDAKTVSRLETLDRVLYLEISNKITNDFFKAIPSLITAAKKLDIFVKVISIDDTTFKLELPAKNKSKIFKNISELKDYLTNL